MDLKHDTIIIRPCLAQYIINDLWMICIVLVLACAYTLHIAYVSNICLLLVILVQLLMVYRFGCMLTIRYILTQEQLIFQHGIINHSTEYMELYRVVDYKQNRSLAQQLFGLKTVVIMSGDRTMPELDIIGVKDYENVVGVIRERVEFNKKRKGIYEITNRI